MFKRFTPAARTVVLIATEEARGLGHGEIAPEHLLLGALRTTGPSHGALAQLGLREGAIRARIAVKLPRGSVEEDAEMTLSAEAVWALAGAVHVADDADEPQVGSTHVLRALARTRGAREVLAGCGVTEQMLLDALREQPREAAEGFAAAALDFDEVDPGAPARALMAIVARRGPVASWLAERGVDASAVRRAFPALLPDDAAHEHDPHGEAEAG